MINKNVFVVIPGFNEEKHISGVIKKVKKTGIKNIIFVDDGSVDNTFNIVKKEKVIALRHEINLGKGSAAKTGCDLAIKLGAKIIILIDSDGQHKPEDIPRFINELKTKKVDIVFGSRKIDKNMPLMLKFGNWFITRATYILTGFNLKDTQSGFRCFTDKGYKKIRWKSTDYSMESEMISNASKKNLKYSEIFIDTIYIDKFKGTTIFDGMKIFINILKFVLFGG
ncbi:glycosyltransferase family 2 protein [Candidatus Woesearchaeota archaeon]|nr:glycosyltransferase family 2 protein [Candidatus Woesearchaeota archaeon]MCF8013490.1 glycosyltransferase family 2 protein [Candidatus Woesearchaeota archaeon]